MMRRAVPVLVLFGFALGCQADLSWKAATFELGDKEAVYDAAKEVLSLIFAGKTIYEQREAGLLETDYIFRNTDSMYRQKVYVAVTSEGTGTKVEVMAVVEEGEVDVDTFSGVTWSVQGSDSPAEEVILQRIAERVGTLGLHREGGG